MSIKDTLLGFIDNTGLADKFRAPVWSKDAARKPLLDGIKRTREQFSKRADTPSKAPNKWWQVKNGVVALTVKVKGDTFDINGVATNHMPEERFGEFLSKFEQAVNAGEFDDELKNKGNGDAKVRISKASKPASSGNTASITGVRRSVGSRVTKGQPLDEIAAALKAAGKYDHAEIDQVIAEKQAEQKA